MHDLARMTRVLCASLPSTSVGLVGLPPTQRICISSVWVVHQVVRTRVNVRSIALEADMKTNVDTHIPREVVANAFPVIRNQNGRLHEELRNPFCLEKSTSILIKNAFYCMHKKEKRGNISAVSLASRAHALKTRADDASVLRICPPLSLVVFFFFGNSYPPPSRRSVLI